MKFDNIVGIQKATSEQVRKTGAVWWQRRRKGGFRGAGNGAKGGGGCRGRRKILCARISCFKQCDKMVLVTLNWIYLSALLGAPAGKAFLSSLSPFSANQSVSFSHLNGFVSVRVFVCLFCNCMRELSLIVSISFECFMLQQSWLASIATW